MDRLDIDKKRVIELGACYVDIHWKSLVENEVELSILSGGYSSRLYLVEDVSTSKENPIKKFLVRLYGGKLVKDDEPLKEGSSEVKETLVFYAVGMAGLGPKLYGSFEGGRVEQFVPSHMLREADYNETPEIALELARKLARYHALDLPISKERNQILDGSEKIYEQRNLNEFRKLLNHLDIMDSDELENFDVPSESAWLKRVESLVGGRLVTINSDLNKNNILIRDEPDKFGERVMIIDYELTVIDYRGRDLGQIFIMKIFEMTDGFFSLSCDYPDEDWRRLFITEYLKETKKLNYFEWDDTLDNVDHVLMEAELFMFHTILMIYGFFLNQKSDSAFYSMPIDQARSMVKRHDCATCNKSFANESLLSVHFQLIHDSSESKKGDITDNPNDLPKYPCDKCNRLFKNPSSALYHKNSEHNHFRFVCLKCGKSFKHKQLLRRHQLVHSQDRPYSCSTCGATFKTKPNLLNHLPIHNPVKNHHCHICKQSFAHKTSLKLHLLWHSGSKPFSCKTCGKSFSQNGNLQEHIRIHTNVRPFSCQYCDKKFRTSSQCQIHSKRHNANLRPYSCHICSKSFLQHDVLKTHLRRHNNEKPFSCSYCAKSFSEHWAMIKHCRTHTKEKPYQCSMCPKTFADCSNLTKHKKTHQNKSVLSENISAEQPSTSQDISFSVQDNMVHPSGKVISTPEDNLFDTIVLTDVSTSEISDSTVWRLTDQSDINKDNQIFYVTYQDPDLGNRTVKLTNLMNSLPCSQVGTNSEAGVFSQECSNEKLDDVQSSFAEGDSIENVSNIRILCDNSEAMILGQFLECHGK